MCCCHGHMHHHWCYSPGYEYGPPPGPGFLYARRSRRSRAQDLADYLQDLEEELARVRYELQELQQAGARAGQAPGG